MRSQIKTLACVAASGGLFIAVLTAGQAQATNTGQPHEDRVWFVAGSVTAESPGPGWQPIGPVSLTEVGGEDADGPAFDPRAYPPGAAVRLRYVANGTTLGVPNCMRMFDASTQTEVPGTRHCFTPPADRSRLYFTVQTGVLHLAATRHVYNLQAELATGQGAPAVLRAELIINWTE